jgi:transcriptional regulator with XRE-family HTH domain
LAFTLHCVKELPLSSPSGRLALVLRDVIERRGIKQKALAKQIGISESSFSLILNARARPRQITITRLMQQLNCSPGEQQAIVAAYDHAEDVELPLKPTLPERPISEDEMDRVRRYMEVKSMSVAFEQAVEKVLKDTGVIYEHPYRREPYICDFYVPGPPSIAIECKFNVNRDWDRTVATVRLLKEQMGCNRVLITIPFENDLAQSHRTDIESFGGRIVDAVELAELLRNLSSGNPE